MKRKRDINLSLSLSLSLSLLLLVSSIGCIHKSSGPVTPWERVTTQNAILAQAIDTATQGTIAVQSSGLITSQQAMPVLQFLAQSATIQKQLNLILAQTPNISNAAQVQELVNQIGTSAQGLVSTGALGIKNPKSQQTIGADIQAIVNSANIILNSYQAAVGGK